MQKKALTSHHRARKAKLLKKKAKAPEVTLSNLKSQPKYRRITKRKFSKAKPLVKRAKVRSLKIIITNCPLKILSLHYLTHHRRAPVISPESFEKKEEYAASKESATNIQNNPNASDNEAESAPAKQRAANDPREIARRKKEADGRTE
jgi:hypothetical protein